MNVFFQKKEKIFVNHYVKGIKVLKGN